VQHASRNSNEGEGLGWLRPVSAWDLDPYPVRVKDQVCIKPRRSLSLWPGEDSQEPAEVHQACWICIRFRITSIFRSCTRRFSRQLCWPSNVCSISQQGPVRIETKVLDIRSYQVLDFRSYQVLDIRAARRFFIRVIVELESTPDGGQCPAEVLVRLEWMSLLD